MKKVTVSLMFLLCFAGTLAAQPQTQPNQNRDRDRDRDRRSPQVNVEPTPVTRDARFTTSFAPVIKKAAPSVVNIYTTKTVRESALGSRGSHPFFDFFFDENEGPRNRPPRMREEQSLGSGVVLSEDGYILTNNHVVEDADEVKVAVGEDRRLLTAKVIGGDPHTDIAVLKVDGEKLRPATVADSDKLEVGDVVLAIGNPFGVGQTVTMGIVSAMSRGGFNIVDYEDFIQTDASINPGNSGGALVDAQGRLVGINTAILSRTGGNQGVGFAVPINMARTIMDRILKEGKVVRGYLGINPQDLTPDLAEEFGVPSQAGALVGGVFPDSPAARAGLREGDVIVEISGRKIVDRRQLRLQVAQTPPGSKVTLRVLRNGKERNVEVTLDELPTEALAASPGARRRPPPAPREADLFEGLAIEDLDGRVRRQFEVPAHVRGAIVAQVDPGSAAASAGLRPGDIIMEVNRQPVTSADEVYNRARAAKNNRVLLRVWSQGSSGYVHLDKVRRRN